MSQSTRLRRFLLVCVTAILLAAVVGLPTTTSHADDSQITVNVSGNCGSLTVEVNAAPYSTGLGANGYLVVTANASTIFKDLTSSIIPFKKTVSFSPAQPGGTTITWYVGGQDNDNDSNNFASGSYTCSASQPIPLNSVFGKITVDSKLYGDPEGKYLIAGAKTLAGQTWYVFDISKDQKFFHIYIANGTTAWIPVSNVVLQAKPQWETCKDSADDDNPGFSCGPGSNPAPQIQLVVVSAPRLCPLVSTQVGSYFVSLPSC